MINATDIRPIIRAQDVNSDAIETLRINLLSENGYKKDDASFNEIPLHVQNIDGHCKITYITPIWNSVRCGTLFKKG